MKYELKPRLWLAGGVILIITLLAGYMKLNNAGYEQRKKMPINLIPTQTFLSTPIVQTPSPIPSTSNIPATPISTPTIAPEIDTSDWKVYRNEIYGYIIKYPNDYVYNEEIHAPEVGTGFSKPKFNVLVFRDKKDIDSKSPFLRIMNPIPEGGFENAGHIIKKEQIKIPNSNKYLYKSIFQSKEQEKYIFMIIVEWNREDWEKSGFIQAFPNDEFDMKIFDRILSTLKIVYKE